MRVKFQADADLDGRVLRGLKRKMPEIDFRTAAGAGLEIRRSRRAWYIHPLVAHASACRCRLEPAVLQGHVTAN
jgi:hypothetical protein